MFENLTIQVTSTWWWFLGLSLLIGLIFLRWSYKALNHWSIPNIIGLSAKILALLLLAFILLEPISIQKEPKPGVNQVAILFDNSMTMTVGDPESQISAKDRLQEWLESDGKAWIKNLSNTYKTRLYAVDSLLRPISNTEEVDFSGKGSALNQALEKLRQTYKNKPLAGITIFTDGIPTDAMDTIKDLESLVPVFVVPLSTESEGRDIRIGEVKIRQSAFEDAPIEVSVESEAFGIRGNELNCTIQDADGEVVFSKNIEVKNSQFSHVFNASWKPEAQGIGYYQIKLGLVKTGANPLDDPGEEITLNNNSQWVWIDHGQNAKRILYVSGRPNWEFKFLNRAISEDPLVDLIGLIRIAKREPKFQFKGRTGETSNPLFRGFDKQDEETEQFDQPVLKRLNVRDEKELSDGFPRNEKDLFEYDAIILDDLEAEFFSRNQLLLLREFVNRRGGGLLMLGGMESMSEGGYADTPMRDILPIYLNDQIDTIMGNSIRLSLTSEGWLQPWARMRSTQAAETQRRDDFSPYQAANIPGRQKPGASVIMYMEDENGSEFPALVTQRYGKGKTACLMVTDFWRPGMQNPDAMADVKKSWRQMLRWLTADVPQRIQLDLDPSLSGDNTVDSMIKVLNEEFFEEDNASARIVVTPVAQNGDQKSWEFEMLPSIEKRASLETQFSAHETGAYSIKAFVKDSEGIPIATTETGWTSNPLLEEFRNLQTNDKWIEDITQKTKGEVFALSSVDKIESKLSEMEMPESISKAMPLWHEPWILGIALLLLLIEWSTRRMRGLA